MSTESNTLIYERAIELAERSGEEYAHEVERLVRERDLEQLYKLCYALVALTEIKEAENESLRA
jgi:hypothetical protein